MKTVIHIIFDTSDWEPGTLEWDSGFQGGLFIDLDDSVTLEEIKEKLDQIESLGHKVEVIYKEDE